MSLWGFLACLLAVSCVLAKVDDGYEELKLGCSFEHMNDQ